MKPQKQSEKQEPITDFVEALEDVVNKLQALEDNDDGGTLQIVTPDGKTAVKFTMPPRDQRNKLSETPKPSLKKEPI